MSLDLDTAISPRSTSKCKETPCTRETFATFVDQVIVMRDIVREAGSSRLAFQRRSVVSRTAKASGTGPNRVVLEGEAIARERTSCPTSGR